MPTIGPRQGGRTRDYVTMVNANEKMRKRGTSPPQGALKKGPITKAPTSWPD